MDDPLAISLTVTGIGMLILFLALALLYGLMYLMTALLKERPGAQVQENGKAEEGSEQGSAEASDQSLLMRRAAVVAVALARTDAELSGPGAPEVQETAAPRRFSPWRALHYQRQLTRTLRPRSVR